MKLFLRRSFYLPVFYSAHQGITTFTGMTNKMGVQCTK